MFEQDRRVPSGLRTSPTGRVPQWVLDESVGRPVAPDAWRSWAPAAPAVLPARRIRRGRDWMGVGGAVLVVAIAGASLLGSHLGWLPSSAVGVAAAGPDHPSAGHEAADAPLGSPVDVPVAGTYDFVQRQDDGVTPVAYDPCRPVHYVIRPETPRSAVSSWCTTRSRASRRSPACSSFTTAAPTRPPVTSGEPYQPDRYGDRWAPVLVTWDTVTEQPDLAADVAGLGGSLPLSIGGGPWVFVTGAVSLDAAQFASILTMPGGDAVARAIVLHEFGHVLGLAHVSDPGELMYPEQSDVYDFAAGDLAGLAQLGAGACEPAL